MRIPDLRGRYIVEFDNRDGDNNELNKMGCAKKHFLTMEEMPRHNHRISVANSGLYLGNARNGGEGNHVRYYEPSDYPMNFDTETEVHEMTVLKAHQCPTKLDPHIIHSLISSSYRKMCSIHKIAHRKNFTTNENFDLLLVLILGSFLALFKLGSESINQWDEARQGMNAIEMIIRQDYINLYFGDKLDTWNVKPPLMIWAIALCYKVFGVGEFALRLPSALASIGVLYFMYKLSKLYTSSFYSTLACLILLSCKGLLSHHIGRTGDMDALLAFFMVAAMYHFLLYHDFNKKSSIIWGGFFMGLAFYTKGPATVFVFPGMLLYMLLQGTLIKILKNYWTWIGISIYVAAIFS